MGLAVQFKFYKNTLLTDLQSHNWVHVLHERVEHVILSLHICFPSKPQRVSIIIKFWSHLADGKSMLRSFDV